MSFPGALPPTYGSTRDALHRLARYVITAARVQVDGSTALTQTGGGFGTPVLVDGSQIRVEGTELVVLRGGAERRAPITTLRAAADLVGVPPDPGLEKPDIPGVGDLDEILPVDPEAAAFLALWYRFGFEVLAELRSDPETRDASEINLWSHHFDPALECLSDDEKRRGSYGCSPGDREISEPYLYVAPWYRDRTPESDFWNATTFHGAEVRLGEIGRRARPAVDALAFFRRGRDLLAA